MNIDKAIESSEEAAVFLKIHHQWRLAQGVELGTEALKRQKMIRGKKSTTLTYPLPGETEE